MTEYRKEVEKTYASYGQVKELVKASIRSNLGHIKANLPWCKDIVHQLMISGPAGTGKSEMIRWAREWASEWIGKEVGLLCFNAAAKREEDIQGILKVLGDDDNGFARWIPMQEIHLMINTSEPLIVELQDFGQWNIPIQKTLMPALDWGERMWGGHKIPDNVMFIATTNDKDHKAGCGNILQPVQDRFTHIVHLDATVKEYAEWAAKNLHRYVATFLQQHGEELAGYRNMTNTLAKGFSFRTMEKLSAEQFRIDANMYPSKSVEKLTLRAVAGKALGDMYYQCMAMMQQSCDISGIIDDPDGVELPKHSDMMREMPLITEHLISAADKTNVTGIGRYLIRVADMDNSAAWGSIFWHNAIKKSPTLEDTTAHSAWVSNRKERDQAYVAKWK